MNRQTLLLAKDSIEEDQKYRQIEQLPKAGYIFEGQYHLKRWHDDINEITNKIQLAIKNKDAAAFEIISKEALMTPKGLVRGSSYRKGPSWLSEIWLAGAQYDFHAPLRDLFNTNTREPFWDLAPALIERGENHSTQIRNLLNLIDHAVPKSYSEAPASIRDSDFISD